jgi:hypothetical protein
MRWSFLPQFETVTGVEPESSVVLPATNEPVRCEKALLFVFQLKDLGREKCFKYCTWWSSRRG